MAKTRPSEKLIISYDARQEPLSIPLPVVSAILTLDNPADPLALFVFLYHQAKIGGSSRVALIESEILAVLEWGKDKFRRSKGDLVELNLIESYMIRNEENGRLISHGIAVKLWDGTRRRISHPVDNPTSGETNTPSPSLVSPLESPLKPSPEPHTSKKGKKVSWFEMTFPDWCTHEELQPAWEAWLKQRKALKLSQTEASIKTNATRLKKVASSAGEAVAVIEQAIEAGWKRLYALSPDDPYLTRERNQSSGKYTDHDVTHVAV